MKKVILILFFLSVSLISFFMFIHSSNMLERYESSLKLSVNCKLLINNYEIGSPEFNLDNAQTFEEWQFCIAQDSHHFFSVLRYISIPVALFFIFLAFHIRETKVKIKTKSLTLVLLSPILFLFLFGLFSNTSEIFFNHKNSKDLFENPKQIEATINHILLIFIVIVIAVVKIFIKLIKKYRKSLKTKN
ncbi:MAG: hypothetical protein H6774_03030 [Pseudomonadales bacterium]|nr:hypothetical protein [Pseudomonadales bacterium]